MPNRIIPLHELSIPQPDDRVIEWCKANDIDPNDVPALSSAQIIDEKFIAFVTIQRDDDGRPERREDGGLNLTIKVPIVVPMKSAPENHGL